MKIKVFKLTRMIILFICLVLCLSSCGNDTITNENNNDSNENNNDSNENNNDSNGNNNNQLKTDSEGLEFTLLSDETGYKLTSMGTCIENDVIVPKTYNDLPIVSIGDFAFRYCFSLKSITIPDSVTTIGDGAFDDCTSLTSITIGTGVTTIGDGAFDDCTSLTSITIPSGVTSIGELAFRNCDKLVEVYNLSSLEITAGSKDNGYIGNYALDVYTSTDSTSKLHTTEDGYIFYENGDTVYLIGYTGSSTTLTLPDKYNGKNYDIYQYAFAYMYDVYSLVISNGVTNICQCAFFNSSFVNISISSSVTSIGNNAFDNCYKLVEVYNLSNIDNDSEVFSNDWDIFCIKILNVYSATSGKSKIHTTDDGYIFYEDGDIVYLMGYTGSNTTLTLPNSYNDKNYSIYKYAFSFWNDGFEAIFETPQEFSEIKSFGSFSNIENITIQTGVTSIGYCAFGFNGSLKNVTIGSSVTSMDRMDFVYCSSLKSVKIEDGITNIPYDTFLGCSSLTNITIPDSVTEINSSAFFGCSSLVYNEYDNGYYLGNDSNLYLVLFNIIDYSKTTFTINKNTKIIMNDLFSEDTSIKNVYYEGSLEDWCSINFYSQYSNPMKYVSSIKLKNSSSDSYEKITELIIPNSITEIKSYQFYGFSSITSVVIPSSVTKIDCTAFEGCSNLSSIYYNGTIEDWLNIKFNFNSYEFTTKINHFYLINSETNKYEEVIEMEIPNTITSIGDYQFTLCGSVLKITIPSSVTSIEFDAFDYCNKLKEIYNLSNCNCHSTTSSINVYTSNDDKKLTTTSDGFIFYEDRNTVYLVGYTGSNTTLTLPDDYNGDTYSIASYAFANNNNISSIIIGSHITGIGTYAFRYCRNLTSVTIGSNVTSIGRYAFQGCFKLVEVYNLSSSLTINAGKNDSNYSYAGYYALDVYTSTDSASKLKTTSDGYIFYEDGETVYLVGYNGNDTTLALPDKYNEKLYSVYKYAFAGSTSIINVTIPEGITTLGSGVFYGCSSLEKVVFPNSITSLGGALFTSCSSLKFTEYNNAYYLGNDTNPYLVLVKAKDNYNSTYEINENAKIICYEAFQGCAYLTSIVISNNIVYIGTSAFRYCTSLSNIIIPSSVLSIGNYVFTDCTALVAINYTGTETEWNGITIGNNNDPLTSATITYNYVG